MNVNLKNIIIQSKELFKSASNLFLWLAPLAFFLLVTFLPKIIWKLNFEDYLEFLRILIWPCTILIILFFFKKIATYLFFSMDGFNFFGVKGNLKDINNVITEEVDRKFSKEKNEKKREKDIEGLNLKISKAEGSKDDAFRFAKEAMDGWKKCTEWIDGVKKENRILKKILDSYSNKLSHSEQNLAQIIDDSKTSDSILEESNINK